MTWNGEHTASLEHAWSKFRRKAFALYSLSQQQDRSASGAALKKVLGPFDLVLLGIGGIIGAGVFVLTGAAAKIAGPAVVVSYAIAALAALIAALCYAEFAADMPIAGGAFNYVALTFGEFPAWVVAMDLILEYTLSAAAVSKGFSAYLASLCGFPLDAIRWNYGPVIQIDPMAMVAVLLLSAVLAKGMAESSLFNIVVNIINLLLIAFVLCAGFPHVQAANYAPFAPYGVRGVFAGAAVVFFSFIGFDTVATAAEEVKNPGRDLPIGIVGSLCFCSVIYMLMCVAITGMQYYTVLDVDAPFAVAFKSVGLPWAERVVAAGAVTGIITSLLVSLLGQARIYVVLGRAKLMPPWLAKVNSYTGTPLHATAVTACTAGLLALLFNINVLAELVSIGTLVVFVAVCAGVLHRRYHIPGSDASAAPVAWRLACVAASAIGFSVNYTEQAPWVVPLVFLGLWLLCTLSFYMLPVVYAPATFRVPLCPMLPSFGILALLHLIGSLGWPAYVRWVVWFVLGTLFYVLYGMHHSQEPTDHLSPVPSQGLDSRVGSGAVLLPSEPNGHAQPEKGVELSSVALRNNQVPQRPAAASSPSHGGAGQQVSSQGPPSAGGSSRGGKQEDAMLTGLLIPDTELSDAPNSRATMQTRALAAAQERGSPGRGAISRQRDPAALL